MFAARDGLVNRPLGPERYFTERCGKAEKPGTSARYANADTAGDVKRQNKESWKKEQCIKTNNTE